MFKGRTDVYSKKAAKSNTQTGKTGYYTQCWNFWKDREKNISKSWEKKEKRFDTADVDGVLEITRANLNFA